MIRLATQADLSAIDQLILQKAQAFQAAGKTQWVKYLEPSRTDFVTHDVTNGTVYVYETNGTITGSVSLIPPTAWDENLWDDSRGAVYLHRLVVDDRMKGQQIGEQLMRHALAATSDRIRLDCVATNSFLNAYYPRFGFRYVGERDGFSLFETKA
ncbi:MULTISPECIES: GNAT family N-acetyltransferase [unclassified Exiguobacterium]|uniref:GNAT family N-acetyltransferase n=1 Tax=unclassified Exiguobacterium TaxID=2644629 RepID=UPI00103CCDDD|nr:MULTISPECIES: GNAT family N-acetyltransferase [unclassified Exiguobacterium]TCI71427.1 GNAT family N-acetyltransferase [Exiguobacterium sp. IPCI3]TCI81405.1 GNAT family N-acetyltransferase [Exiguobacterium sp. IPCH1]TCI82602.1 GNAT family N-acetyltransferase [Exiguobacterium sp. IPBC4]